MSDVILESPEAAERGRPSGALATRPLPKVASQLKFEQSRGGRLEELLALFSLILVLGTELVLVRVGLDPVDEGYFLEQATRVAQGQLPYRDFDSLYTPALLYVHATMLSIFSSSPLLDVRITGLLARLVLAGGLYLVCRPLVRPAFAVLPSLYILVALDRIPFAWEPHPGWPSAALTVVAAWAYMRLRFTSGLRRNGLLVAIGALAALVFALKQNAGVLLGLALVVSTAWQWIEPTRAAENVSEDGKALGRPPRPGLLEEVRLFGRTSTRTDVTRALRAVQLLLLLLVFAVVAWLLRPHASPPVLAYFLIPLVGAAAATILPVRVAPTGRGVGSWLCVLAWLGLGWSLISLPWLVALLAALDWDVVLLQGFVGVVNQDVLWYPLQGPSTGAWASLLGIAVGLLALVRWRHRPLVCTGVLLVVLALAASMVVLTGQVGESFLLALVLAPGRAAEGLALFIPVLCIVGGAILSLRPLPARTAWLLRWMTVASALTFLTEYPRMDEIHLTWSACLPLATGTVVLARLYTALTRRWAATGASRYVMAAALVLVPVATGMRNLGPRTDGLFGLGDSGSLTVQLAPTTILSDPPVVAGMAVSTDQANTLVAAAQFLAANTAHGEAIFMYPTSPLMYVLANRPNPTRFAHLYPGAASPAELERVIATLEQTPVNFVIVFESDLAFWGVPAENAPLETYLVDNYHQIRQFGEYRVLRRR